MSYILDALRRAEAERGRGAVPGLHSQTVTVHGTAPAAGRAPAAHPALLLGGALALATAAAAGTWWAMQGPRGAPAVQPAAVATVTPPDRPPAQPSPPVALPAPSSTAAQPALEPGSRSLAVIAPPGPVPPPVASPGPRATEMRPAEKLRDRSAPGPAAQQAPTPPSPPAGGPPRQRALAPVQGTATSAAPGPLPAAQGQGSVTAPSPTAPVFAQADLPEAIRSQLPVLKISGATYSNNPAHRMAIVNGQVLLEGDQAGPGLVLERVEPQRTVWSFRGYRYAVGSQ